ncbi:hypothetical protein [Ruminococcus sp. NK3A76]|uniref:hypothetical protein n=1 Tax=Ruminococcus sp. NK3A76 TaxID=877411 RepID=UPI000490194A|nr:hypothetical protein [Ruminococcus sp. NK3A76]
MKKQICIYCMLLVIIVCLSGCDMNTSDKDNESKDTINPNNTTSATTTTTTKEITTLTQTALEQLNDVELELYQSVINNVDGDLLLESIATRATVTKRFKDPMSIRIYKFHHYLGDKGQRLFDVTLIGTDISNSSERKNYYIDLNGATETISETDLDYSESDNVDIGKINRAIDEYWASKGL